MTLGRLPVLFRFFALFFFFSAPLAILGMIFFGLLGAGAAAGFVYLFLTAAAIVSERAMVRAVGATIEPSLGLKNSFEGVIKDLKRQGGHAVSLPEPQLLVFADPLPNALCAKGLVGEGVILLSSGMLAQFEEPELREVLEACYLRTQQSEWIFVSLCSTLLNWLLPLAPRTWIDLFFSTKGGAVAGGRGSSFSFTWFLVLLPSIRFLLKLGQPSRQNEAQKNNWDAAMRKVIHSVSRSGREENPSLSLLWVSTWGSVNHPQKFFLPLS